MYDSIPILERHNELIRVVNSAFQNRFYDDLTGFRASCQWRLATMLASNVTPLGATNWKKTKVRMRCQSTSGCGSGDLGIPLGIWVHLVLSVLLKQGKTSFP